MLCRETRYKNRKIREAMEIKRLRCDRSKSNVNRDDGIFSKQIHGHLCWKRLTISTLHCEIKEIIAEQIWYQINFCKNGFCSWSIYVWKWHQLALSKYQVNKKCF